MVVIMLVVMFYSFLMNNFYSAFRYIFDTSFRASLNHAYSGALDFFLTTVTKSAWTFDYAVIFGSFLFQFLIPFVSVVTTIIFMRRFLTVDVFIYSKNKRFTRSLLKSVFAYVLFFAMASFLSFLIYLVICNGLFGGKYTEGVTRPLFSDWFGKGFYQSSRLRYFFMEGFIRFFYIPVVYSLFGIGVALSFPDDKIAVVAPALYFFGMTILGEALSKKYPDLSLYVTPSIIMSLGDFNFVHTGLIIAVNSIPGIIGLSLIWRRGKHVAL